MSKINPLQYSIMAKTLNYLKNPNKQGGTLLIEVPADIGKAYNGYKRGGIIEAGEKLRKEGMSALVWLFGIPVFNKLGNFAFEKMFNLPMDIDYSKDAIEKSVTYLKDGLNPDNLDVSELAKYGAKYSKKIKELGVDKSVKRIKGAKQAITITSWLLNCFLMGIALPKINQRITANKLEKENTITKDTKNRLTMEQFKTNTRKNNNIAFKGLLDTAVYLMNTNNTARLLSTDVPMIIGRCATARNKYEAFEVGFMDAVAIFFYNFSLGLIEKGMQKILKTPAIDAKVAEFISQQNDSLYSAIESVKNKNEIFTLEGIFGKDATKQIYQEATNGRYGKINKFVHKDEILAIDKSVENLIRHLANSQNIIKDNEINTDEVKRIIKKLNMKNGIGYALGIIGSFIGLGWLTPKVAYFLTQKISGKSGFIGIEGNDKKTM